MCFRTRAGQRCLDLAVKRVFLFPVFMAADKPSLDDLRIARPQSARSGFLGWLAVLVLLLVGGAVFLWWFSRPKPLTVRTAVARSVGGAGTERIVLNASGYVIARREATVSSKVTGKVVEVLVEEGMRVEEGQVLARLDDTNLRAGLRLAEAQRESAKAALEETRVRIREAEINLRRTVDLAKSRISAQAELDRAEAEVESLKARLAQQQAQVRVAEREVASWQSQLDDTIIRAPFSGIVTSKNAQPGEMISPVSAGGGFTRTGICTIVDMDSLEVEIDVNESYINRVQPGQAVEATLDAYPDWKIACKVIAIIPTANRQKSTVRVRVGFDRLDPRILPEMGVKVAFRESGPGSESNAVPVVRVPTAAVRTLEGREVVMVLTNGRAERRAVGVASRDPDSVLIRAGLKDGEKVIVNWPESLADGAPVEELP